MTLRGFLNRLRKLFAKPRYAPGVNRREREIWLDGDGLFPELDTLGTVECDPEVKKEFDEAEYVVQTFKNIAEKEKMETEVMMEFIRNIRAGESTPDALWQAMAEWDL